MFNQISKNMAKITKRTLQSWCGSHQFSSETDCILSEFPNYVKIPFHCDTFRDCRESYNRKKLIIYAWRSHGEWAPPTKEIVGRYYLPESV